ncbi:MAG: hypothetical protein DI551_01540 [Micavibrio aeruginosavorus]|uniref:DUF6468 domain-containing protein n=1 Tax=Micavibrio aeruginosavorus TaxID=349221 RepID=A0A2W5N4S9_9BACT|nr:MAG: hypothetical protein DI551_01540 [Micavibrio aeruginosavorus]
MPIDFSLFMDFAILVLLAATVYLAFRLNLNLKNFSESRSEMEGLVNRLTANIDKAETAVAGMQNTARKAGIELDEVISDAKKLRDELKFMNETGNNLASRLENVAERNRALVDKIEEFPAVHKIPSSIASTPVRESARPPQNLKVEEEPASGFAIRDRDYDGGLSDEDFDDLDFGDDDAGFGGLQSQAEREFFEALQSGRARQKGSRSTQ